MSTYDTRSSGLNNDFPQLNASLAESNLHALMSTVASGYVKLLKRAVLPELDVPDRYTIRDLQVLGALHESPKPLTSTDIFRRTGLDPATVTRSTKLLVKDGYINSHENQADSRSRFLTLTEKGLDLARDYNAKCEELFASKDLAIDGPSLDEIQSIERTLKTLQNRVRILKLKKFTPNRR